MIPQGAAWQHLRQLALTIVPDGTHIPSGQPPTLSVWLSEGAFTVAATSGQSFDLTAAQVEIASALFTEAAYHLDHAAEHSVTVRNQLAADRWFSAAWLCVTFYYWAFFAALSLTRLIGKTSLFLSRSTVTNLHILSNSASRSLGQGPFLLECSPALTVSYLNVSVRKSGRSRVHDLIWRLVFETVAGLASIAKAGAGSLEDRLYAALDRSAQLLGPAWPSDLRNLINYSPGKGYTNVRRSPGINAFGVIQAKQSPTFADALNRLEDNLARLPMRATVLDNPTIATAILVDLTFALDAIATDLHQEVVDRRHLDRRWNNSRNDFIRRQFSLFEARSWPYAEA